MVYMIIMPAFVSDRVYNAICTDIDINIVDSMEYQFITPGSLLTMIKENGLDPEGKNLNIIDLESIEGLLTGVRELESVEVFCTVDSVLHIEADQRDPLMRVITAYGNNYYIDKEGNVIPHSSVYTPRLIVVSGNVEVPDISIKGTSIMEQSENTLIKEAYKLARFIGDDKFWDSLVEQIYIDAGGEFEIVPRLGDHIIRFGKPYNYEWKFKILKTFYTETLASAGWDRYDEIDMRFEGQLVCKRK